MLLGVGPSQSVEYVFGDEAIEGPKRCWHSRTSTRYACFFTSSGHDPTFVWGRFDLLPTQALVSGKKIYTQILIISVPGRFAPNPRPGSFRPHLLIVL